MVKVFENRLDRAQYVLKRLDEMRKEGKQVDFLIKSGSEEFVAHKNILSAGSKYFRTMFSHDTEENRSGVMEMGDWDTECVRICVNFVYTGEAAIAEEKYEKLMSLAHLWQLCRLCDGIASMLKKNLSPKTFYTVKRVADMYGRKELEEACERFVEGNFGSIYLAKEFGQLDESYIRKIIKSKNIKISEERKLDALLRWIKYDSERSKILTEMLMCVNLSLIPVEYRRYLIEEDSLLYENNECLRLLSVSVMNSMKLRSRGDKHHRIAIAIFDRNSGHLQCFNPADNTLTQMHEFNDDMKNNEFSAVSLDDHVYVLMKNKSVYRLKYRDKTATWEKIAEMNVEHGACPPATVLSGCIYVIGGHRNCTTKSVEKYDPALNQWIKLTDKPQPSHGSEILASQGYIYTFGGYSGGKWLNKVERFDPALSTWTVLTPMKKAKAYVAAVEVDEKMYVLGGCTGKHFPSVDCYDPSTNKWTTKNPMKTARSCFKAFAIDGNIYAVGGNNSSPGSVEKFDPEKNVWEMVEIPGNMQDNSLKSVEMQLSSPHQRRE